MCANTRLAVRLYGSSRSTFISRYPSYSVLIADIFSTLTSFTEARRSISPVELLDLTLKNHNQEFLDFKEVDMLLKGWNVSRANLRKAVDNLRQIETEVVDQLPQVYFHRQ